MRVKVPSGGTELYWNEDNPTASLRWIEITERYIKYSKDRHLLEWFAALAYSSNFEAPVYSNLELESGHDGYTITTHEPGGHHESSPLTDFDFANKRFFMEYKLYTPMMRSLQSISKRAYLEQHTPGQGTTFWDKTFKKIPSKHAMRSQFLI